MKILEAVFYLFNSNPIPFSRKRKIIFSDFMYLKIHNVGVLCKLK